MERPRQDGCRAEARRLRAVRTEAALFDGVDAPRRSRAPGQTSVLGKPVSIFMDGPLLEDVNAAHSGYVAAFASPWPGGVALHRSPSDSGFVLDQVLGKPATMGLTAFDFFAGPVWRWDRGNELWVDLFSGTLESAEELQVLGGANAIAVENADGEWEVLQFQSAELTAPGRYRLTKLLRGQRGSEHAMRNPVAAGARVLVLDLALSQPAISTDEVGLPLTWKVGPASRDIADGGLPDLRGVVRAALRQALLLAPMPAAQPQRSDTAGTSRTRVCAECGKTFIVGYPDKRRKSCSTRCSQRRQTRLDECRRRAIAAGVMEIGRFDPVAILKRDGYRCQMCGCSTPPKLRGTNDPRAPEVDHIIPLSRGGDHTPENSQCLCRRCNRHKATDERREAA